MTEPNETLTAESTAEPTAAPDPVPSAAEPTADPTPSTNADPGDQTDQQRFDGESPQPPGADAADTQPAALAVGDVLYGGLEVLSIDGLQMTVTVRAPEGMRVQGTEIVGATEGESRYGLLSIAQAEALKGRS